MDYLTNINNMKNISTRILANYSKLAATRSTAFCMHYIT